MLIEFSVANFRSFREKCTFSMVAAPKLRKKQNTIKAKVKGEPRFPPLLKVAAIYGPNASGKSNLLKAMTVINILANAKPNQNNSLPVSAFRFDKDLMSKPSEFEVHFILNQIRYEFSLALTSEKIMHEQLSCYVKGRKQLIYIRKNISDKDEYDFPNLEGGAALHEFWAQITSPKMLFISQAVANSSNELNQLRQPLSWLKDSMQPTPKEMQAFVDVVNMLAGNHPEYMSSQITSLLQEMDVPVTNILFEQLRVEGASEHDDLDASIANSRKSRKITLTHKTSLGEADFDYSEESDGTKNLIGFSIPWTLIGTSNPPRDCFIIDELDSSLHPKIVEALIRKLLNFNSCSQLIFTTHDTHLMDTKLLRRDQVWLTDRDRNGSTSLTSIYEFEGRESEDVEKRYYEGRYRGLPITD